MMFWDEKRRGLTRQLVGPLVDIVNVTTVMSLNSVDSGSFGSLCCAFRRTDTSADPIRLFSIQLALPFFLRHAGSFILFVGRRVDVALHPVYGNQSKVSGARASS